MNLPNDLKNFHVSRLQRVMDWADRHDRPMFVAACAIVAAALLLGGCSSVRLGAKMEQFAEWHDPEARRATEKMPPLPTLYRWQKTRSAAPQPWMTFRVADVRPYCGAYATACAKWAPDSCAIILPLDATAEMLSHEQSHCDGFTHND